MRGREASARARTRAFVSRLSAANVHARGCNALSAQQHSFQATMDAIAGLPPLYPAFIAVTYYAFVLFVAELSRKIVDYCFRKGGNTYAFLIEFIAVAQQCTCVYENGECVRCNWWRL